MAESAEYLEFDIADNGFVNVEKYWTTSVAGFSEEVIPYFVRIFYIASEGNAWYVTENEKLPFKLGHLYILPIQKKYTFYYEEGHPINLSFAHVVLKNSTLISDIIEIDMRNNDTFSHLQVLLRYFTEKKPNLKCFHYAMEILLTEINRKYSITKQNEPWVTELMEYVDNNLDKRLSNGDLALHVKYNEKYLTRVFHAKMGISLHDFVIVSKMNFAKRLLISGMRINEVASKLNITDEKSFTRVFKRCFKYSPKQFKSKFNFQRYPCEPETPSALNSR